MAFGFGFGLPLYISQGSFGAPSLILNFMSGTLDPRIAFLRASSATYYDSAGLVKIAGNNVARFDYNPETLALRGLLIEETRTNLLNWSQTFATAGGTQNNWWTAPACNVSAQPESAQMARATHWK